jgi:hypothetical protein
MENPTIQGVEGTLPGGSKKRVGSIPGVAGHKTTVMLSQINPVKSR